MCELIERFLSDLDPPAAVTSRDKDSDSLPSPWVPSLGGFTWSPFVKKERQQLTRGLALP